MRCGGSARGPWRARRTRKVHCANHGTNPLSSGGRAPKVRKHPRSDPLPSRLTAAFLLPTRAPRRCNHPGCTALVKGGYCHAHARPRFEGARHHADRQGLYWRASWRKARAAYLAEHPLCVECQRKGRLVAATVVDHIIPHRGDEGRFWERSNWASLCVRCHTVKTARGL